MTIKEPFSITLKTALRLQGEKGIFYNFQSFRRLVTVVVFLLVINSILTDGLSFQPSHLSFRRYAPCYRAKLRDFEESALAVQSTSRFGFLDGDVKADININEWPDELAERSRLGEIKDRINY